MLPEHARRAILPWIPAIYCVFLPFVLLLIGSSYKDVASGDTLIRCSLAFLFFMVGAAVSEMQQQIRELRQQMAQLQDRLGIERPITVGKTDRKWFQFSLFELFSVIFVIALILGCLVLIRQMLPIVSK